MEHANPYSQNSHSAVDMDDLERMEQNAMENSASGRRKLLRMDATIRDGCRVL